MLRYIVVDMNGVEPDREHRDRAAAEALADQLNAEHHAKGWQHPRYRVRCW